MSKANYLNLMEKALSAYSVAHILQYFNEVKQNGLTEHGFPRLTANIGILIANGRRRELLPIFLEMMEFCCKNIPLVKAANDFSVREIINCITEIEKHFVVAREDVARWENYLASITPQQCYSVFAKTPNNPVKNWALFTGVSEYFRQRKGLCTNQEFIDTQIASQLQWFDENGMYMDNAGDIHHPIQYDIVPRALFAILLNGGYRGKYYKTIDEILKKAGVPTLNMQSACGEMPFGGRSNQFLHNEAWLALLLEYEAARYQQAGDCALAKKFKAGAAQAVAATEYWLSKQPITHVKNRFPIHSKFGCEDYAYFDKYMITAASFFYEASLICDDSIVPSALDESPMVWSTTKHFHKTFARACDYSLEFDTNADPFYDANGLGRVHKKGAPSAICLSTPFAKTPNYALNGIENKTSFSICPAVKDENGEWILGSESDTSYRLTESTFGNESCDAAFDCLFANGAQGKFSCSVSEKGIDVTFTAEDKQEVGVCLPVFYFDGEGYAKITEQDGKIFVEYEGWVCEYEAKNICNLNQEAANRNGIYKCYVATALQQAKVRIKIYPAP